MISQLGVPDAAPSVAGAVPTSSFVTDPTTHLFKAVASSPTSTLEIKVTDVYGNVYTETMQRPKEFTYTSI